MHSLPLDCVLPGPPPLISFEIHLSYSLVSSTNEFSEPTDDSNPRTKHWRLIILNKDNHSQRIIELLTPDQKQIRLYNTATTFTYDHLPPHLYHVGDFIGDEQDFDRVMRHHPMQGGQYSAIYNNDQHFVAMFLVLLKALANETPGRSFRPQPRYAISIESVLSTDHSCLWNKPKFVRDVAHRGVGGLAVASVSAGFAARVVQVPASGIMGWLGATTTEPAPWAATAAVATTVCGFVGLLMLGAAGVGMVKGMSWKRSTQIKHPEIYGFPVFPRSPPPSPPSYESLSTSESYKKG